MHNAPQQQRSAHNGDGRANGANGVLRFPSGDKANEDRKPPHNYEAEQAVLGAILIDNSALDRVVDFLEAHHFFDPLHGQIYNACVTLISAGEKVTPVTLKQFFENAEPIDATMTVPQYLGRLGANATTVVNARDYGRVIVDLWTRRQLILISEDLANAAYDGPVDFKPSEQIEEAETRLVSLLDGRQSGGEVLFKAAVGGALAQAKLAHEQIKTGMPTGLVDLDEMLGGLQPGDLIVLAARPGMGKSAMATNMTRFIASQPVTEGGGPVGFFSLEMGADQIALRVVGEMAEVSPDLTRRGKLAGSEYIAFRDTGGRAESLPIIMDETSGLSIAQLVTRARRMKRKHNIGLIVVDYLQLMHAGKRVENRNLEITAITAALKGLAKELCVPVLALSQLSREVEKRADKRPQLSDLRESGSIEQDADVVMFIYREEYYLRRERPPQADDKAYQEWNARLLDAGGNAEVIIAKQRQGGTGIVNLAFSEKLMRFSNLHRGG